MNWHAPEDLTLYQYLDGSLPPAERQAFAQHLRECPGCKAELEAAGRLEQLSQRWKEVEPPAGLGPRIGRRIKPASPARGWILAAAAAALVGFAMGRLPLRPRPPEPQVGQAAPTRSTRPSPAQLGENPAALPLEAEQIWTTTQSPEVVGFAGQILELSPHSRLELVSRQGNRCRLRLSQGQVRIQEHGELISVETRHLLAEPLGTDYQVSLQGTQSRVEVFRGQVLVRSRGGQSVQLAAGQNVQFPSTVTPTQPPPATPAALPGPGYPQHAPVPHTPDTPKNQDTLDWAKPRHHRRHPPGEPGLFRNPSVPGGRLRPQINRRHP